MLPCTEIEKVNKSRLPATKNINEEEQLCDSNRQNTQAFKPKKSKKYIETISRFEFIKYTLINVTDLDIEKHSQIYGRTILVLDLRTDSQNEVIKNFN